MPPSVPGPLSAAEIKQPFEPSWFPYESTATLAPLGGIVAQPRALRAIELGLGVQGSGYNIFVVGLSGTNLPRLLRTFVEGRIVGRPVPNDWVYVINFDEPDRPLALTLPAGLAILFRKEVRELPQKLALALPRAMQYQGFNQEKDKLLRDYNVRCDEMFTEIQELGRQRDLHIELTADGNFLFAPLRDLQPMPPEEVAQLPPEEVAVFSQKQIDLLRDAQPILERQLAVTVELNETTRNIERTFAEAVLTPIVHPLWEKYTVVKVRDWLERLKQHMLDNVAPFFAPPPSSPPPADDAEEPPVTPLPFPGGLAFEVNVMVDNTGLTAPPVLIEDVPTYKNLLGFVERTFDFSGRIVTDFTQIKSGSLLRANGGFLLFNLDDAINEPLVWKELLRTLKNRRIQIDTYDINIPLGASGMRPEPIPLDVKLLVVGSLNLFYYLSYLEPDFPDLFKVKAEFTDEIPLDAEGCLHYARLVRMLQDRDGLLPFDPSGVGELVRFGSRLVADRRQLSADFSLLAGLAREADHWCRQSNEPLVRSSHVRQAMEERVYRSNWFAEQTLNLTRDGIILIQTVGKALARINGLTVLSLGDYTFGRPCRLSASAWVGQTGIINIERESRLSGSTHDKGMLIMEGYLRGKYAQHAPIGLGASIAFEQSYSGVDGDSASAAELFCLVSALSGLPLRQDVGVTGSVNQQGEIQAIGGVNEKIEGFFDVCRLHGLTGEQGVCFPRSNVVNLVLRHDVVEAITNGQFHLWPIASLDEGLELLTGVKAGDVDEIESVHGKVAARFRQISQAMNDCPPSPLERAASAPGNAPSPAPPSPPSLPPHG